MFYLIFLIPLLLISVWYSGGNFLGAGESGIPFFNLDWHAQATRFAWKVSTLGDSTGITTAAYPTYWVLSQFEKLNIPPYLIQAGVFYGSFVVAGVSIYLLSRELFPTIGKKYYFTGVLFYWFNLFSLVNVWNRFENNYLLFFGLFPLVLFLYLRGLRRERYLYSIMILLALEIFSFVLTSVPFVIIMFSLFGYTTFFDFLTRTKNKFFPIKFFILTLLLFVVVNIWWISQLIGVSSSSLQTKVDFYFTTSGNLYTLTVLSQKLGNLVDLVRFKHATFFTEYKIPWREFLSFPLFSIFEFFISGVIFFTIAKNRKQKSVLYLAGILLLGIFLSKGNNPPLGEIFDTIFSRFSVLQVFRNPFEKLGLLMVLAGAPLLSLGVCEISNRVSWRFIKRYLLVGICSVIILLWGFPFWTGFVFTGSSDENSSVKRSYAVKIPSYYRAADEWLKGQEGIFRFLTLPIGGEGITYNWGSEYSGIELFASIFRTPNISFNTSIPYFDTFVTGLSKYQLNEKVVDFIPFINAKYIILRTDIAYKDRKMADPDLMAKSLEKWIQGGILKKVQEFGKLGIYEVADGYFWPKIYLTNDIFLTNDKDDAYIANLSTKFPDNKIVTVDYSVVNDYPLLTGKTVVKANKIITQNISDISNLSDEDLLARLFYAKHLPGSWYYPFVILKEDLKAPPKGDAQGWLLYEVGLLGKRASEIYSLKKINARPDLINQAERNYNNKLNEVGNNAADAIKSNMQISGVVKDSLVYQFALLKRSGSKEYGVLSKYMYNFDLKPYFDLPDKQEGEYVIYSFDIPKENSYKFVIDIPRDMVNTFLDGKPFNFLNNENVKLTSGIHEFAILARENVVFSDLFINKEIHVNNDNLPRWIFNLRDMSAHYKIEYDYRFTKGKSFELRLTQNVDKTNDPVYSNTVVKDDYFHDFKHVVSDFSTSVGATNAVLSVFPSRQEICKYSIINTRKCEIKDEDFEVEISDIKITKLDNGAHLIGGTEVNSNSNTKISWERVDQTMYKVKVDKSDVNPEVLVFSELFNGGWKAYYTSGEQIPDSKHLFVNGFGNGWVVDRSGNYELTIKYKPEDNLVVGKKISFAAFSVVLLSGGILLWRRKY